MNVFLDPNKLGQKLLESMGWEKGKGLGKDENGIKEHIRVDFKLDNKGLGFKCPSDDQWMVNNSDYEDILAHLALHHNNGSNIETKVSNLEEKSKNIRNRVHYHKLIRAKNLSQCSQNDLSSIFPKKRENSDTENKYINKSLKKTCKIIEESLVDNIFESNTNIDDYFKSKMDKLKVKNKLIENNYCLQLTKEETSIENVSQKLISIEDEKPIILEDNCVHPLDEKRNKDKKVKKSKVVSEEDNQLMGSESTHLVVDNIDSKKNKRKKEKNSNYYKIEKELDSRIDNNLSDESFTKVNKCKKSKREEKMFNESESCNNSKDLNEETISESNSSVENLPINKSLKKLSKKLKNKIRLPKGYDKHALSVNDSLKNYYKTCEMISKDNTLNTTNLISIHGYGYETD